MVRKPLHRETLQSYFSYYSVKIKIKRIKQVKKPTPALDSLASHPGLFAVQCHQVVVEEGDSQNSVFKTYYISICDLPTRKQ